MANEVRRPGQNGRAGGESDGSPKGRAWQQARLDAQHESAVRECALAQRILGLWVEGVPGRGSGRGDGAGLVDQKKGLRNEFFVQGDAQPRLKVWVLKGFEAPMSLVAKPEIETGWQRGRSVAKM